MTKNSQYKIDCNCQVPIDDMCAWLIETVKPGFFQQLNINVGYLTWNGLEIKEYLSKEGQKYLKC